MHNLSAILKKQDKNQFLLIKIVFSLICITRSNNNFLIDKEINAEQKSSVFLYLMADHCKQNNFTRFCYFLEGATNKP